MKKFEEFLKVNEMISYGDAEDMASEIKRWLVDMALAGTLPEDMTTLSVDKMAKIMMDGYDGRADN